MNKNVLYKKGLFNKYKKNIKMIKWYKILLSNINNFRELVKILN